MSFSSSNRTDDNSKDMCECRMNSLKLTKGETTMAAVTNPNTGGKVCAVLTNVFGLEIEKDLTIYVYKINVMIMDGSKITRNGELMTLKHIQLEICSTQKQQVYFNQKNVIENTANRYLNNNDRSYSQFIELVLKQKCIIENDIFGCYENGKVYCLQPNIPNGYDRNDYKDIGEGKYLLPGYKNTVQYIEGPHGRNNNNPSIVVDAMKAAFHKKQTVIEKVVEICGRELNSIGTSDIEKVTKIIKGLNVYSMYTGRRRNLRIEGIHKRSAIETKFELKEGGVVRVADYFQNRYNIQLRYSNMNLLICKERGNINYYPMELMTISGSQRVQITQQTTKQTQITTKECAMLPMKRQRMIMIGMKVSNIIGANELMDELGIRVYSTPLMVNSVTLDNVNVEVNKQNIPVEKGKWKLARGTYQRPSNTPPIWAIYAIIHQHSKLNVNDLENFKKKFMAAGIQKGIIFNEPTEIKLIMEKEVEDTMVNAANHGCKYILCITDDLLTNIHGVLKLIERNNSMIIQNMKISTVLSIINMGKHLTLENIMNKVNVKLGGINYEVNEKWLTDDQLIIGIGQTLISTGTSIVDNNKQSIKPMVIGYSSNAVSSQEYIGDFIYNPLSANTIGCIEDIITNTITLYLSLRNGKQPKRVIIYRTGTSDGAYPSILSFEIPLIRATMKKMGVDGKLMYIVVTKDHTYRLFKQNIRETDKVCDQNIGPGLVIDQCITHPSYKQFFLHSHTTLQGSAKTARYTVVVDDCNVGMEKIERLTYGLCHQHQIVTLSTSIPTPLYIANEYAKRGRMIWIEKMKQDPSLGVGLNLDKLKMITDMLSYKQTDLYDKRVNA